MKKILIAITLSLTLLSCQNYLDIQPRGSAIPRTAEDYSALLNSLLSDIDNSRSVVVGNHSDFFELESFSDNTDANLMSLAGAKFVRLYVGQSYENKGSFADNYSQCYKIINVCNVILDGLADDDTALAKDVKGATYAIRGVCYYELLRQFCEPCDADPSTQLGVPLVLEPDMEARPIRSMMNATMDRIEKDLMAAKEYDVQDPMFRFSKEVVMGYLARFYFWTEQYSKAIPYAKEILDARPLLNGDAYKQMHTTIVGIRGNILIKSAMTTNVELRTQIETYKQLFGYRPVGGSYDRLFVEKGNDIRYGLWYGVSRPDWRITKKFPLACMRSAEMCLILAESYYHDNTPAEALRYLNMLRNNRIKEHVELTDASLPALRADELIVVDAKGNSLSPLLYAIHCERRKELFMEGDRWFELKRNGCPEFWVAQNGRKFVTEKFMYTSPLPYHDIAQVSGLIQNTGYDEVIN